MGTSEALFSRLSFSPAREMAAYEALWSHTKASFKTIADLFRQSPDQFPSNLVTEEEINQTLPLILEHLKKANIDNFGVRLNGSFEYPERLRDAAHPIEFFYYRGWWDLVSTPCVAVVGTRNPSEEGVRRTRKLVKKLVEDGFTIVSGLAKGVDTAAHTAAIEAGGDTIAVIGTPITHYYPPENRALQDLIAKEFLLISQVPIQRYSQQGINGNRLFFPERNITMSALTKATIIIEAGETSGTLTQARAALNQGRKLFILDSCFSNSKLTWPQKYLEQGAIRVREYEDIQRELVQA
ncbi:DNA-processing protein DprA [Chitiniphilus eburneus]|uniref:DNA-processing protein DprA n=1 Tax=Chitiniphilus eburneus TaxID=2571148 RepID=A0A4U0PNG9_9NEIS|nr:DNA-processing protein DprA [Chitiniphilus eburneus]TJZ69756.1 DNA-processing protein DprA [Chitiniphilus eburneus]